MYAAGLPVHETGHAEVDSQSQANRARARAAVYAVDRLVTGVRHPVSPDDVLASHMGENRSCLGVERYVRIVPAPVPIPL